jgi:hypothetical protein
MDFCIFIEILKDQKFCTGTELEASTFSQYKLQGNNKSCPIVFIFVSKTCLEIYYTLFIYYIFLSFGHCQVCTYAAGCTAYLMVAEGLKHVVYK